MQFGVFLLQPVGSSSNPVETLQAGIEQAVAAETLGLHAVWVAEHHFSRFGACSSPAVFAGSLAALTKRIRLGIAISVLPLHHPLRAAEDYAMVDVISHGRLDFGIGRGAVAREYNKLGVPHAESAGRLREAIDVVRKAWTSESFSHEGQYYHYEDIALVPRPVQQPHPPLFVGALSPETGAWAAQIGARIIWTTYTSYEQVAERRQHYIDAGLAAGWSRAEVDQRLRETPIQRVVWVADTDAQARDEWERGITSLDTIARSVVGHTPAEGVPLNEQLERRYAIVGSPERVVDGLLELRDRTGYDYVMLLMAMPDLPQEAILRSMRLFSEKVLPKLA